MSDEYKIVQIRDADGRLEWQMTAVDVSVVRDVDNPRSLVIRLLDVPVVLEEADLGSIPPRPPENSIRVLRRIGGVVKVVDAEVGGEATLGRVKKAAEMADIFHTPLGEAVVVVISADDLVSLSRENGKYATGVDLSSGKTVLLGGADDFLLVKAGDDLDEWVREWILDGGV